MKYVVSISRTAWKDFEVEADSVDEANDKAVSEAYNHSWGSEDAEYYVNEISSTESTSCDDKKRSDILNIARFLCDFSCSDYSGRILDRIENLIVDDVVETADSTAWNDDDVRLAVGRALCRALNIPF